MAEHYYSTQPFIAWCFNHYFYGQQHFCYVGAPFYPYKTPNPRSSSPLRIYEDLYEPWKERDPYNKVLTQMRIGLRKGVMAQAASLPAGYEGRLKRVCETIDLQFFYPVVYRVDVHNLDAARLTVQGSGRTGSREYLIAALREDEFDVLFFDARIEGLPTDIERLGRGRVSMKTALHVLERWC